MNNKSTPGVTFITHSSTIFAFVHTMCQIREKCIHSMHCFAVFAIMNTTCSRKSYDCKHY